MIKYCGMFFFCVYVYCMKLIPIRFDITQKFWWRSNKALSLTNLNWKQISKYIRVFFSVLVIYIYIETNLKNGFHNKFPFTLFQYILAKIFPNRWFMVFNSTFNNISVTSWFFPNRNCFVRLLNIASMPVQNTID